MRLLPPVNLCQPHVRLYLKSTSRPHGYNRRRQPPVAIVDTPLYRRHPFFVHLIIFCFVFCFVFLGGVTCSSRGFLFGAATMLFFPGTFLHYSREEVVGGSHGTSFHWYKAPIFRCDASIGSVLLSPANIWVSISVKECNASVPPPGRPASHSTGLVFITNLSPHGPSNMPSQVILLVDSVFKREGLSLRLRPYAILCCGDMKGLVECITDAKSVDHIKKTTAKDGGIRVRKRERRLFFCYVFCDGGLRQYKSGCSVYGGGRLYSTEVGGPGPRGSSITRGRVDRVLLFRQH